MRKILEETKSLYKEMVEGINKLSKVKTKFELIEFLKTLGDGCKCCMEYGEQYGWDEERGEFYSDYDEEISPDDEHLFTEDELLLSMEDVRMMKNKVQKEIKLRIHILEEEINLLKD